MGNACVSDEKIEKPARSRARSERIEQFRPGQVSFTPEEIKFYEAEVMLSQGDEEKPKASSGRPDAIKVLNEGARSLGARRSVMHARMSVMPNAVPRGSQQQANEEVFGKLLREQDGAIFEKQAAQQLGALSSFDSQESSTFYAGHLNRKVDAKQAKYLHDIGVKEELIIRDECADEAYRRRLAEAELLQNQVRKINVKVNSENFIQLGGVVYHIDNQNEAKFRNDDERQTQQLLANLLENQINPTEFTLGDRQEILRDLNFKQLKESEKQLLKEKEKKFRKDMLIDLYPGWEEFYPRKRTSKLAKIRKEGRFLKRAQSKDD